MSVHLQFDAAVMLLKRNLTMKQTENRNPAVEMK